MRRGSRGSGRHCSYSALPVFIYVNASDDVVPVHAQNEEEIVPNGRSLGSLESLYQPGDGLHMRFGQGYQDPLRPRAPWPRG